MHSVWIFAPNHRKFPDWKMRETKRNLIFKKYKKWLFLEIYKHYPIYISDSIGLKIISADFNSSVDVVQFRLAALLLTEGPNWASQFVLSSGSLWHVLMSPFGHIYLNCSPALLELQQLLCIGYTDSEFMINFL